MGGWMCCCKGHLDDMIKDIKKNGKVFNGYADGDRRMRCDFQNCKERSDYEVFWGNKSWDNMIKEGRFVPLKR